MLHPLDLAPEIQAHLGALAPGATRFPLTERRLRDIARMLDPDGQVAEFEKLVGVRLSGTRAAADVRAGSHELVDRTPGAV